MKVGLVTFYHIHHYGAMLQAAAMLKTLDRLGTDCEIIDYYVNQDNRLLQSPLGLRAAVSDLHTLTHYAPLSTRYQRFEKFSQDYLKITNHNFTSLNELRNARLPYELILSGGDQIWNPRIFPDGKFDPVFFGTFSSCRKIAYAPSFGSAAIPEGMKDELREYLSGFSHLSVREKSGADIIREILGTDVPVMLEPVLLLSRQDWLTMASHTYSELHAVSRKPDKDAYKISLKSGEKWENGYILCYCISSPGSLETYVRNYAAQMHLPVLQLCGTRRKICPGAKQILDAGPAEFIELFAHASAVFTNSFHGSVFSVLLEKPFFASVSPAELANPEHSRIFSLLSSLGLADRVIGRGTTADLTAPISYAPVSEHLQNARKISREYLQAALEDRTWTASCNPFPAGQPVSGRDLPNQDQLRLNSDQFPPSMSERSVSSSQSPEQLPRLADQTHCTGCTACASVCPKNAIVMRRDKKGFACPVIQAEKCIHCALCTRTCPALQERGTHTLPAVYAAWNKDTEIRRDSTSGGVFTAIAEYVIHHGGVVFGAAFNASQKLGHIMCFQKEELWRLRGAKYVQSDLGDAYRKVRHALRSRLVLFSGTPCQVDGLYHFLGSRPENLITCDLICQGVPSPGVWEDTVRLIQNQKGKNLCRVRFRDKVTGWQDSYFTTVYDDGTVDSAPLFRTEYGRAFGRALFLRDCCHQCRYTNLNRPGDFTLGDLWGLGTEELADQQLLGISLLLVNTRHASRIFDQLPLWRQAFPLERAIAGNPRLVSSIPPAPDRSAFFAAYALEPFDKVRQKYLRVPSLPARAAAKVMRQIYQKQQKP